MAGFGNLKGREGMGAMTRRRTLGLAAGALAAAGMPSIGRARSEIPPMVRPRAPAAEAVLERIAFGSCLHQDRPAPALDTIHAARPDVFLFLGDNVYGDDRDDPADLTRMKTAYDTLGARDDFRRLLTDVPVLSVWDDHDYGQNDGGADYPSKAEAERLFLDFWGAGPDDARRRRPGIYHSGVFGPEGKRVQILLLDTRTFRSPLRRNPDGDARRYGEQTDPNATLLGAAQWDWLARQLAVPAEFRILCSSIQIHAEGHGWERWSAMPRERDRLYALLRDSGVGNLLLLSGDRHLAAIYAHDGVIDTPLLEVTSSSLNSDFLRSRRVSEAGPRRVTGLFTAANWGFVTIDWTQKRVETGVRDAAGTTVYERTLSLPVLGQ